jgi:hypothetical protein
MMALGLNQILLKFALRPRVVHRLPGRLRVHLPALERIPPGVDGVEDLIGLLIEVPEGVNAVEPHRVTGNILIQYDPDTIGEAEVLEYLKTLLRVLRRHQERLMKIPPERLPEVVGRLRTFLRESIRRRQHLDPDLEFPKDVLE